MIETLKANDGSIIRLGRELGRGGEGVVFDVEGQPGFCAKIYAAKAVNARLHDKLRAMVADPPKDPTVATKNHHSIAWPTRLLYRGPADALYFAGFVMPAIAGQDFKKAICRFHPGDRRKEFGGDFTWLYAYTAAMNIASAVAAIHERGYCIGDINESNILVAGSTMSTLIDCDSFQVRDAKTGRVFRCVVGKPEYTAPELGGKHYADVDRTAATDHFGLAVLMFQFLMEGCHPYQARGPLVEDAPTTEKKISLGYFPYRHAGKRPGVEPPAYAPPFDILHPELQGLFVRAFVDGHKDPRARPTSLEWYGSLSRLRDQIVDCKANPNHRYFSQLGACPWCRLRGEKKGEGHFPEPGSRPAKEPEVRKAAPKPVRPALKNPAIVPVTPGGGVASTGALVISPKTRPWNFPAITVRRGRDYFSVDAVVIAAVFAGAFFLTDLAVKKAPRSVVETVAAFPKNASEPFLPSEAEKPHLVFLAQAKAEDVEAERLRQAQVAAFVAEARRLLARQKYVAAVNELKKANALGGSPEVDGLLAELSNPAPAKPQGTSDDPSGARGQTGSVGLRHLANSHSRSLALLRGMASKYNPSMKSETRVSEAAASRASLEPSAFDIARWKTAEGKSAKCCADAGGSWRNGSYVGEHYFYQGYQRFFGCCNGADINSEVESCRARGSLGSGSSSSRFRCARR